MKCRRSSSNRLLGQESMQAERFAMRQNIAGRCGPTPWMAAGTCVIRVPDAELVNVFHALADASFPAHALLAAFDIDTCLLVYALYRRQVRTRVASHSGSREMQVGAAETEI